MSFPKYALSIRQPWAWAILHAGKNIENRSWGRMPPYHTGGHICLHAAVGMTKSEYEADGQFIEHVSGLKLPAAIDLTRGAIVGTAKIERIVEDAPGNPWFMGKYGLILTEVKPLKTPILAKGALGYFEWQRHAGVGPDPQRWMMTPDAWKEFNRQRVEREATLI